jgi:hypothetical protein
MTAAGSVAGLGYGLMRSASPSPEAVGHAGHQPSPATGSLVRAWRSASCGCCGGWLDHLRAEGFQVEDHVVDDLEAIKRGHGVPPDLASCHTATLAGYVIEGHVPAGAIRRLLRQRPEVAGIAVPGMPLGSPGMESPLKSESYTLFSFDRDGSRSAFQRVEA